MGYSSADGPTYRVQDFGFDSGLNFGGLYPATITYGSTDYTVTELLRAVSTSLDGNTLNSDTLSITVSDGTLPDGTVLTLGGTEFTVGTDSATLSPGREQWDLFHPRHIPGLGGGQELAVCANLPPGLKSARVDGTSLVLTYDQDLDTGSVPATSAYAVKVDGGAGAPPSSVSVSGREVTLTLATAVTGRQTATVNYTVPASNPIRDGSGLDALPFTDEEVATVDTTPPELASAEVLAQGNLLSSPSTRTS